jgi:hypothetical protein
MAEICVKAVLAVADLPRRDVNLDLIKVWGPWGGEELPGVWWWEQGQPCLPVGTSEHMHTVATEPVALLADPQQY